MHKHSQFTWLIRGYSACLIVLNSYFHSASGLKGNLSVLKLYSDEKYCLYMCIYVKLGTRDNHGACSSGGQCVNCAVLLLGTCIMS